jgi:hypothetical protein
VAAGIIISAVYSLLSFGLTKCALTADENSTCPALKFQYGLTLNNGREELQEIF